MTGIPTSPVPKQKFIFPNHQKGSYMPKMTKHEYMAFFTKWLNYQFPRTEDDWNNFYILKTVSQIVSDDDELQHWANRDNWSMLDYAKAELKANSYALER